MARVKEENQIDKIRADGLKISLGVYRILHREALKIVMEMSPNLNTLDLNRFVHAEIARMIRKDW